MRIVVVVMAFGLFACGGGSGSGGAPSSSLGSSLSSSSASFSRAVSSSSEVSSSSAMSSVAWSEQYLIDVIGASEVTDLLVAPDNQLYVAGYIKGVVGQTNIEPAGNTVGVAYQLNAGTGMGANNAFYQLDTSATDVIEALAYNSEDERLYFAGRTNGTVAGQVNFGQFDVVFGALENNADPTHLLQLGSATPQHPVAMNFTRYDDVAIAGYNDIYVPSNYVEAWRDPFLMLLSPSGDGYTRLWDVNYVTAADDDVLDLAVAPGNTDQIVIVGNLYNTALRGSFAASYDSDASVLWRQQLNFQGLDQVTSVVIAANGNIFVGGTAVAANPPLAGVRRDFVVFELDSQTGERLRTEFYGTEFDDQLSAMALDAEGNLYLAGELTKEKAGTDDLDQEALLIKVNPQWGVVMRKRWYSPAGLMAVRALAVNHQQRAFLGGYIGDVDNSRRQGVVVTTETDL